MFIQRSIAVVIMMLIWGDFYFSDTNCKTFHDTADLDNITRYSKSGFMNKNGDKVHVFSRIIFSIQYKFAAVINNPHLSLNGHISLYEIIFVGSSTFT